MYRKVLLQNGPKIAIFNESTRSSLLKRFAEADFAGNGYLVSGHAAFEEIREFLNVLQVHKTERIFCAVSFLYAEHRKPLVRDEFQIAAHIGDRKTGNAAA